MSVMMYVFVQKFISLSGLEPGPLEFGKLDILTEIGKIITIFVKFHQRTKLMKLTNPGTHSTILSTGYFISLSLMQMLA